MASPKTLNQIVKVFNDIADNHEVLEDFGFGQFSQLGAARNMVYPILWTSLEGVTTVFNEDNKNYTHMEMDIQCILADKVNDSPNPDNELGQESTNGSEITSDMLQIMTDILVQLTSHPWYVENNISITGDVFAEPGIDMSVDRINAITFTVTLKFPFKLTVCGSPFKNLI